MKKTAAILLILSLLLTCAACQGTDTASDSEPVATDAVTSEPVEIDYNPNLEAIDCGGDTFKIISRKPDGYVRQLDDISAEEQNGDYLNDAIYKRNSLIMDKYNLNFEIIADSGDITGKVRTAISSGDDAYDLVINGVNSNVSQSAEGLFYDLGELPNVDITKPYWSRSIMEDMSIFGKHYVGISDLTIQAYYASGIIYFNKQLAEDFGLEDPYTLVREGDWTFDKMIGLCRDVSRDLNGNQEFDEQDQYGLTFNNFAWQILFYGGGETFIRKNDDGSLYFDSANERILNFLQKLMPVSQDSEVVLYSENYSRLGGNYRIDVCQNAFNEGRSLFWLEAMYGVPTLRDMERDFGILPVPKFDAAQEEYASFIHTTHGSSVAVPVTVADADRVGRVLEDLTYYSSGVRDAFIETTLKGKYARDNESADMIDIIIDNIRTDYALLLNNAGLSIDTDMRRAMDNGSTDIGSLFASKSDAYNSALEKYSAAMEEK